MRTPNETESDVLQGFAARMHEICDDMGVVAGRGRQTELGGIFSVNAKSARKWLQGIGYPEMSMAVRIANWADVNVVWLLQGYGLKRGTRIDGKALVLDDAIHALPPELGADLIDNLRAKLIRAGRLAAEPEPSRYRSMLEAYEQEISKAKQ